MKIINLIWNFIKSTVWPFVKKNLKYVAIILVIVISFVIGKCSTKPERQAQINNLIAVRDSVHSLQFELEGVTYSGTQKDAVILSQSNAIEAGLIREDVLKKLHIKDLITNTELSGIIHRQDSLLKLPPNTIFITVKDTSGVTHDYARLPFTLLDVNDKYLSLNAGMSIDRKAWYNLSIPFSGTVSVGYVGTGFLNLKKVPKGIFTTDIPYLKVNDMSVVIIEEPKGLLSKWYIHAGIGAAFIETVRILLTK